jgi:hypothetical protein
MASLMIGNFGNINGVQTFRVCGSKDDLYKVIDECRTMGHKFHDTPNLTHVRQGQWTMLLQLKVPVEVGASDKST